MAGAPNFELTATGSGTMVPRRVGRASCWPIFQYVEAVAYQKHGLDARAVLVDCPTIRIGLGPGTYGWTRLDKPAHSLQPDDRVALTVAGMAHLKALENDVQVFLEVLSLLVQRERSFHASPIEVQDVSVHSGEIGQVLSSQLLDS
jgi:hypothetical protein